LLIFDDAGEVNFERSRVLSADSGCLGMDIPPGVWHSLVTLEDAVIYEVKGQPAGGYVSERDKDFAAWSPPEGSLEAAAYLQMLEDKARRLAKLL
jgi:cupin fold WbuC family metalloprotein